MILRFQVLECEKRPKVIDFEFNSIYKALDFLMKGRPLSDFKFDVSQYLLYTRGNVDNIVYQVTLLDKETEKNIELENPPLKIRIIYKYISQERIIEKICTEEEFWGVYSELNKLHPRTYFYEIYHNLPVERVV